MAFPGNLSTGTVTGTFLNSDGEPARGSVRFTPEAAYALDADANVILVSLSRTVRLDTDGSFSLVLAATDDPDLIPADFTYRVRPMIDGLPMPAFSISVPSSSDQDLADIAPVPGSGGTLPETPLDPAVADLVPGPSLTNDALVELIEATAGGGGGGAVDSVNGETGVVVLTKGDIGLGNVDNTTDVGKPVSTATATAIASASTSDRARSNHTGTQSAGTITGLATVATSGAYSDLSGPPTIPDDSTLVHKTGTETVAGVKTFSSSPVVPDSSFTIAKTTGLQTALDAKAASSHTHAESDITGLVSDLAGKAATSHSHAAADVTSGTLAVGRIGSGTAAAGKYVDGGTGAWTDLPEAGGAAYSTHPSFQYPLTEYGLCAAGIDPEWCSQQSQVNNGWVRMMVPAGWEITGVRYLVTVIDAAESGFNGFAMYEDDDDRVGQTSGTIWASLGWQNRAFASPIAAQTEDRMVMVAHAMAGSTAQVAFANVGVDSRINSGLRKRSVYGVTWGGSFPDPFDFDAASASNNGWIPLIGLYGTLAL